jgi:hypothetical protein
METEQWLEEAMVITNKSLRLMPSRLFRQCLDSCRDRGLSLVAIASVGNQLGLIDEKKLLELKESIPEPNKTPPRPADVVATKQTYRRDIDTCRFYMNSMIGIAKEIPVIVDSQPPDEKANEQVREVVEDLARQVMRSNDIAREEGKDEKGDNNSTRK